MTELLDTRAGEAAPLPGRLTLAAVGDCILRRRVSVLRDPDFLSLAGLLRDADCACGNCEVVLADPQAVHPVHKTIDPHVHCAPWGADELRFMGLDLLGTANNHTMDFGDEGLAATLANLERVGIVHAGAGPNLPQAARPGWLDTSAGRVGLVACASTFLEHQAAGPPHPVFRGRPGLNPLQIQYAVEIERALFESLAQAQATIHEILGWDEIADVLRQMESLRPADTAVFFDTVIKAGEAVDVVAQPRTADVTRILQAVAAARQKAQVVVAAVHSHEMRRSAESAPPFLFSFARSCVDAGADLFLVTGPHVMRGIEIYRGKPIFYSLGNFFAHLGLAVRASRSGASAAPGEPAGPEPTSLYRQRRFWESFVPCITFAEDGEVVAIELHPIILGLGGPPHALGTPRLARGEPARAILDRLVELSRPCGTAIDLDGEIGRVQLE